MTVIAQVNKTVTVYSASFTFPFTFRIKEEDDVVVVHVDQSTPPVLRVLSSVSDYTVSASPWLSGGNVSIAAGDQPNWTVGDYCVCYRKLELSQETDYIENDAFSAESHELTVDVSRMIEQDIDARLSRALLYPVDSVMGSAYDATGRIISDVADPVDAQDAATKRWTDITFGSLPGTTAGPAGPQFLGEVSIDRGDNNVTLAVGVDDYMQRFDTELTAARTVTLNVTGAYNGAEFFIVRTGLGAFSLDIGGLTTISANSQAWAKVKFDGTAWVLIGYGRLDGAAKYELTPEEITAGLTEDDIDEKFPGNPGAWVERYQKVVYGVDYTVAIQTALDVAGVSPNGAARNTIILPRSSDVQLTAELYFDRGNVTIIGWGPGGGTTLTPQTNYGFVFKHTRATGRSSDLQFQNFGIDGQAASLAQGFHIENTGALNMQAIEISNCGGMAVWFQDCQDPYYDLHIAHCGSVTTLNLDGSTITETGAISTATDSLVLSVAGSWKDNMMIRIAGAGPGGADLETIITNGGGTTNPTVADKASTTVTVAVLTRIYPSGMWGNNDELGNPVSGQNNSMRFARRTWLGRYRDYGFVFYFATDIFFQGKVHGRTTSQESDPPGPVSSIGLLFDRCNDHNVIHSQFVHTRGRGITNKRSGGSRDCSITVGLSNFNSGANYEDPTDFAFIEGGANTQGVLLGNTFRDDLSGGVGASQSYPDYGVDILLQAGHNGYSGFNEHFGAPGGGRVVNNEPGKGQPFVSRTGRPLSTMGPWIPILEGSSVAGDHTYTTQKGYYRLVNGMIHAWANIEINSAGTPTMSGNMKISGLPLGSANAADAAFVFYLGSIHLSGAAIAVTDEAGVQLGPASTSMNVRNIDTDGAASNIDETYLAAGMQIRAYITYPIDE